MLYYLARLFKRLRFSAIRNSWLDASAVVEAGSQVVGVSMQRHSYCGFDCVILDASIGSFCSISDRVVIGGSEHPMHFVSMSPVFLSHRDSVKAKFSKHEFERRPHTSVGHDVWIGHSAMIKSGVVIGTGAVVGMGSVVTKDVPPYSVVAGNPARVIKYRFDAETIQKLLRSKWWEFDDVDLRTLGASINNPADFLATDLGNPADDADR